MQLKSRSTTSLNMPVPMYPRTSSITTDEEIGSTLPHNTLCDDQLDGATTVMIITSGDEDEKVNEIDGVEAQSIRSWDRVKQHLTLTKSRAKQDSVRLMGLLAVLIACIVCIGLKIQAEFFMPVVTLLVGIIIESPLAVRKAVTD